VQLGHAGNSTLTSDKVVYYQFVHDHAYADSEIISNIAVQKNSRFMLQEVYCVGSALWSINGLDMYMKDGETFDFAFPYCIDSSFEIKSRASNTIKIVIVGTVTSEAVLSVTLPFASITQVSVPEAVIVKRKSNVTKVLNPRFLRRFNFDE